MPIRTEGPIIVRSIPGSLPDESPISCSDKGAIPLVSPIINSRKSPDKSRIKVGFQLVIGGASVKPNNLGDN